MLALVQTLRERYMDIKFKVLNKEAHVPSYATKGSAGFDLYATEDVVIQPLETKLIPTGLEMECPEDTAIMIFPRSGLSAKTPLRLANGVGVIDSDYRGEIQVIMYNDSKADRHMIPKYQLTDGTFKEAYDKGYVQAGTVVIKKGDRIAQGVLMDITQADFKKVSKLGETERGKGGFGSSGK